MHILDSGARGAVALEKRTVIVQKYALNGALYGREYVCVEAVGVSLRRIFHGGGELSGEAALE